MDVGMCPASTAVPNVLDDIQARISLTGLLADELLVFHEDFGWKWHRSVSKA
jgi:hypothetical protein